MDKQNQYTPFKHSLLVLFHHQQRTNNSQKGISIIEMIASMLISALVVGVAFSGFNIYRQSFVRDQSRNQVNQSLTGVSSLIEPDILQIGQGLTDDPNFETVKVVQRDIPGTTEKSSVLTITKAIVSSALPICDDITAGNSTNRIMIMDDVRYDEDGNPDDDGVKKSGCQLVDTQPSSSSDGDGWPDILKVFRDNRINQGGTISAYIHAGEQIDADGNKVNEYELFNYTGEVTEDEDGTSITPSPTNKPARAFITTDDDHTWVNDYSAVGTSRIHVVERRSYFLDRHEGEESGTLKLMINPPNSVVDGDLSDIDDDNINVLTLADGIANFEVIVSLVEDMEEDITHECRVIPPNGDSCFPSDVQYSWAQIQYIETQTTLALDELDLSRSGLKEEDLVLTERFFPRNVFSF